MDISLILSIIAVFLLVACFVYLIFIFPKRQQKLLKLHLDSLGNQNQQKEASELEEKNEEIKKSAVELKEKMEEISQKLKTSEEVAKVLLENVDKSIKGEIVNQQKLFQEKNKELSEKLNKDLELRLNNNQQLIKTHLENLNKGISQPLEKLNSVLLHSGKRGIWGNTQLDELLSSYLPKENGLYQTEFQLKKRRTKNKEEGLRVDAIVFSADNRNNIAIDSKFPLENYLSSADSSLTEEQKEQFEKRFENDVKKHIDKVAEYFSPEEDGIKYVIMFVPSEVIFSKINEQRYYNIVKLALEKKVSICSPSIFLVIIDQLRLWNKIWEQYKDLDKITSEISKFWGNLKLFKERWEKIVKTVESNNEAIRKFNISARKLIEDGEKIKNRDNILLKNPPKDLLKEKEE
jgi:DNA recombination protein RmuC